MGVWNHFHQTFLLKLNVIIVSGWLSVPLGSEYWYQVSHLMAQNFDILPYSLSDIYHNACITQQIQRPAQWLALGCENSLLALAWLSCMALLGCCLKRYVHHLVTLCRIDSGIYMQKLLTHFATIGGITQPCYRTFTDIRFSWSHNLLG